MTYFPWVLGARDAGHGLEKRLAVQAHLSKDVVTCIVEDPHENAYVPSHPNA